MQPRKSIFAFDYIEETQGAFFLACKSNINQEEFCWVRDVLTEFYRAVGFDQSPLLSRLASKFKQFIQFNELESKNDNALVPYANHQMPLLNLNYQ